MQGLSIKTGPRPTYVVWGAFEFSIEGDPLPRGETGTKNDVVKTPFGVRLDQIVIE